MSRYIRFLRDANESGKTENQNRNYLYFLSIVFFLVSFVSLCIFIKGHFIYFLNSDDSSELILSKLLSDEKKLITENWFYSTELRAFNTQILYSFFFNFTQNWHLVRFFSCVCLYIIMLLSLLFLMDRMKIKKYFFFAAGILCIPFSNKYFYIVQHGAYYIPHIAISFLAIGLIAWIADSNITSLKTKVLIGISFLLAVLAGIGGARQVAVTYLPLLVSGLFIFVKSTVSIIEESTIQRRRIVFSLKSLSDRSKLFIVASAISFIGSAVGYEINTKVLSKIFSFYQYNISFSAFDIKKFSKVIAGFLNILGFTSYSVFSYATIYNIVCFICASAIVVSFIYGFKQKSDEVLYSFTVICFSSALIFTLIYTFTDMTYLDRYNVPITVLFVPLSAYALSNCSFDKKSKSQIMIFIVLLLAIRGITFYIVEPTTDSSSELRIIADTLTDKKYFEGYATFWNANILTELSNGSIEVWDWADTDNDFKCIDQTHQWLQLKSHIYEHPKDRVFWVLTNDQNNSFHFPKNISSDHKIYETPNDINWDVFEEKDRTTQYKVYGFTNYDEMYYLAGRYSYNKEISMNPGKTAKADATVLYPDTYTMICTGENLEAINVEMKYRKTIKYKGNNQIWNRPFDVEDIRVENGSDYLVCDFSLNEIATDFQPVFTNCGDTNAKVSSVQLFKKYIYYADFWSNKWLKNGIDKEGIRHLNTDAKSYGPYISLVPGKYLIECDGENLNYADFDCLYKDDNGNHSIELKDIDKSGNTISFTINVSKVLNDFQVRFFNNSNEDVTLNKLTVVRNGT